MKIENVETFIVGNPPPHYGGQYFIFIKVTSNNIVGWGECYAPPFHPRTIKNIIQDENVHLFGFINPSDIRFPTLDKFGPI